MSISYFILSCATSRRKSAIGRFLRIEVTSRRVASASFRWLSGRQCSTYTRYVDDIRRGQKRKTQTARMHYSHEVLWGLSRATRTGPKIRVRAAKCVLNGSLGRSLFARAALIQSDMSASRSRAEE